MDLDKKNKERSVNADYLSKPGRPMLYGFGKCTPSWLQWCTNPKMALFWLSWFCLVQGFAVNGINNVNVSTLGQRYRLPSSRVGLISSAYDISAAILVLPLSYLAVTWHQPRMLWVGALVMALGSFIMTIPQWTSGIYEFGNRTAETCDVYGNLTSCAADEEHAGLQNYLYVLMLGQGLHGVGGCMLFSIGIVFLDTHVSSKNSPVYQGIFFSMAVLGPAIGYVLGGYFLTIYVDFYRVDTDILGLRLGDPQWVGAWYLGFSISFILFFTVFLGLLPLPHHLPNADKIRAERQSETHADGSEELANREDFGSTIKDVPVAVKIILGNPTNLCLNFAACSESLNVSGFATFMPQFLQTMYGVTAGEAATLVGLLAAIAAGAGQLTGGLVVRAFKLKVKGMLKMCITLCCIVIICQGLLISLFCTDPKMAGVNREYLNTTIEMKGEPVLRAECNEKCVCNRRSFEPVCGRDNTQYFSPCHAGCDNIHIDPRTGARSYGNCSCIIPPSSLNLTDQDIEGQSGRCRPGCNTLPSFLAIFFVVSSGTFMMVVPAQSSALRCVPERARTLGMAVRGLMARALGTVPGPIIYGAIFDRACLVWQEGCSGTGACWIYDRWRMALFLLVNGMSFRAFSCIMFLLAHFFYKPPKTAAKEVQAKTDVNNVTENKTAPTEEDYNTYL